jgi:AcrR family transcriptional regulator
VTCSSEPDTIRIMADSANAPRRSGLLQTRSRDTRRKLIDAALDIWNDGDFEAAFEATTVATIARAAGVSKGTFYFHFAGKQEILLEIAWGTARKMIEEADVGIRRGTPLFELVDQLMKAMARRVSRTPKSLVLRAVGQWSHLNPEVVARPAGVGVGFEAVIRYGQDTGTLPEDVDVYELAALLHAATLDALVRWSSSGQSAAALRDNLCRRADIVLRGAITSYGR